MFIDFELILGPKIGYKNDITAMLFRVQNWLHFLLKMIANWTPRGRSFGDQMCQHVSQSGFPKRLRFLIVFVFKLGRQNTDFEVDWQRENHYIYRRSALWTFLIIKPFWIPFWCRNDVQNECQNEPTIGRKTYQRGFKNRSSFEMVCECQNDWKWTPQKSFKINQTGFQ